MPELGSEIQARETTRAFRDFISSMSQTRHDLAFDRHLGWDHPLIFKHDASFIPPDDSISMIADAYENDDFWYSASRRNSAQTLNKEVVQITPTPPQLFDESALCFNQKHNYQNPFYWPTTEKSGMFLPLEKVEVPIEHTNSQSMVNYRLTLASLQNTTSSMIWKPQQAMEKASFCVKQMRKGSGKHDETSKNSKLPLDTPSSSDVPAPKNFVAQPQTSYNFFFTYERERLLEGLEHSKLGTSWDIDHYVDSDRWSNKEKVIAFQTDLLQKHWSRDRTIKRKHRKTHFRVPFQTLTRQISKNWHSLPIHVKAVFHEVAAEDYQRYQFELQKSQSKN
jgi:hypothetical protein